MLSEFRIGTKIVSGRGSIASTGDQLRRLGVSNVLLICDPIMAQIGMAEKIVKMLEAENMQISVFSEVEPDPTLQVVEKAVNAFKSTGANGLIALGGGSSIDTAKAVGVLANNPGTIEQYRGFGKILNPMMPLLAIPTTAGTGSEVTPIGVVIDMENKNKFAFKGDTVQPHAAILDPELLTTLPPSVIAFTGLDTLTHAIETYTSTGATELTDSLALAAIRLVGRYLPAFHANPANIEAAEKMQYACTMAGAAFAWGRLHTVHAMAHALGGRYRMPHGIANAVMLPHVMQFSLIGNLEKYRNVAIALGKNVDGMDQYEAAQQAVNAVKELNANIGIPAGLKVLGVPEDEAIFEELAINAEGQGITVNCPRKTTVKDMVAIFKAAM